MSPCCYRYSFMNLFLLVNSRISCTTLLFDSLNSYVKFELLSSTIATLLLSTPAQLLLSSIDCCINCDCTLTCS